jgi:hypothetical protein
MSIQFRKKQRAQFYAAVAGLSEIMAGFIRHLSPTDRRVAIRNADCIARFINIAKLQSIKIQLSSSNSFGFQRACESLSLSKDSEELQVGFQELESLWNETTAKWSSEHWLALKMALHTRLPGTERDSQIDAAADKNNKESSREFHDRLASEEAEIEARLDNPGYWEQIRKDLNA